MNDLLDWERELLSRAMFDELTAAELRALDRHITSGMGKANDIAFATDSDSYHDLTDELGNLMVIVCDALLAVEPLR